MLRLLALLAPLVAHSVYDPPDTVRVRPVLFVARGEHEPSDRQAAALTAHVGQARARYLEWTSARDTFAVHPGPALRVHGAHDLEHYRSLPGRGLGAITAELFDALGYDRFDCPFIFVVLVASDGHPWPRAVGRPFNGGLDTGGGAVLVSSYDLDSSPHFGAILAHELGHAFGLAHVDAWGGELFASDSIMSYDPRLYSMRTAQPSHPSGLVPEDLRALALNSRVFPRLTFDAARDVPRGHALAPQIAWLPPMTIPGQKPYAVRVQADTPSASGRSEPLTLGPIAPPDAPFDPRRSWSSARSAEREVELAVTFPIPVTLTALGVHTQCGEGRRAADVRVLARPARRWRELAHVVAPHADARIDVPATTARHWRVVLGTGPSGRVALRGLRFQSTDGEVFPFAPPYALGPGLD